jgi:peptidase M28-like protein
MRAWIAALLLAACEKPLPAPPPPVDHSPPVVVDLLGEASLVADIHWLTAPARAGRGSRSPEAHATAEWIAGQLRIAGYTPQLQPIADLADQVNVIAAYGPATGRAILVVAHYDHLGTIDGRMYPGADDNASGVAVALAIARDLRVHPIDGRVVFVFTGGEELGLLGARTYASTPTVPITDIRAVYNLDMVGRHFFASSVDQDARLAAVGLPENAEIADAALRAAETAGLELLSVRAGLLKVVGEDRRSDDWMFRDRGVFAVHFSTGLNDDYHEPTDTEDKLSHPQLVRIAAFLRALVAATAR